MAEAFEPITTQEAFDAAVADRLAPYADYDDLKAQNADLNARIQTYETDASSPASPMRSVCRSRCPRG